MTFIQMLAAAWQKNNSLLCVGLDPDPAKFPAHLKRGGERDDNAILEFCTAIVDATADLVCAFKPQIAYFAACRAEDQLEALIAHIHEKHPGVPVILDAKRGDIGATAEQYASEAFERFAADAVTVNPYMGRDSLEPWLAYQEKGVILLCRTSNPGGSDLQFLDVGGEKTLRARRPAGGEANGTAAARSVSSSAPPSRPKSPACVKSSATCPCWCRASAPRVATSRPPSRPAAPPTATGLMINSSRAILYAGKDEHFAAAARQAALETRDAINLYR